jgi:universal stress protein A
LRELEAAAMKEIGDTVRERAARYGIAPDRVAVRYGRPASEIHAEAERIQATLIVIGAHGRHGLPRLMLGSTANAVLHGAACDVLVVRIDE